MIIDVNNIKIKQEPNNANVSLSVNLASNDTTLSTDTQLLTAKIDTTSLSPTERTTVNNFIALIKSKL